MGDMGERADNRLLSLSEWMGAIMRYRSNHPSTLRTLDTLERLLDRPYRTHVLIRGEAGTGKEGLARALHAAMHPQHDAPFVKIPTGGRDPQLLAFHLFGTAEHPGAIERAAGGTIFLDEVATMPREVQARISPALRGRFRRNDDEVPREADVVVIAATDHDLNERVREGEFRHDLFFRLARIDLTIPPLRERPEDVRHAVVWIANRLLDRHENGRTLALAADAEDDDIVLTDDALAELESEKLRGNFRELDQIMERALMLYREDDEVTAQSVKRALGKR